MPDSLDQRLARLAAEPTDRPLDRLEAEVMRDVARVQRDAGALKALAPLRLAAAGLALTIGATAGGAIAMAAVEAPQAGAFSGVVRLAPSTLLEGEG